MSVDKANLALLLDLLSRIGKNTDSAGTSSLFAQLAQIAAYTDGVEAKTNLIGTSADSAGTATIFARLAQLAGYTDTLETLIGTTGAAAGTGSVFARLAQIAAYVDTLEVGLNTDLIANRVGNTGDAASSNGTLMSRLAYLIANGQTKPKTPQTAYYIGSVASNNWVTVVNVSGAGALFAVGVRNTMGTNPAYMQIRITIDGIVTTYQFSDLRLWFSSVNGTQGCAIRDLNVFFTSSLKIEITNTSAASLAMEAVVDYGLV
ncbi:hypothetical protein [Cohnella sp.]|uniref:hypothetical protein n=1 Tax=Cohnella sp. TaxID=1883426 RepID=UPI003703A63A